MKDNIKNVQLSFCCKEDWNQFKVNDQGRFCDHCSKTVIDFTKATAMELRKAVEATPSAHVCGRFSLSQMSRGFAAAALVSTALQGCQPEPMAPELHDAPPIENTIEIETVEEFITMGIIAVPTLDDSVDQDILRETDIQFNHGEIDSVAD